MLTGLSLNQIFEERYEILEVLGAGGVGTVYKARQLDAKRMVALKVLHEHLASDNEFKERFLREARSLNRLSHANIVTVYHLGLSDSGIPYLVMELVQGQSLRQVLLAQGSLELERSVNIVRQLCSALTVIHENGIVHRDLKPENIVLMQAPEPDFVKLIDFGLARNEVLPKEQKLTATGLLIGSPAYMSPEQCRGEKADSRSDLYSLTVCFYEMLSGHLPFAADNPIGMMYKHANEEPQLLSREQNAYGSDELDRFLLKGMRKDPLARFQKAEEMSAALELLSESCNKKQPTFRFKASYIWALALSFFAVLFVLTCLIYLSRSQEETRQITYQPIKKSALKRTPLSMGLDEAIREIGKWRKEGRLKESRKAIKELIQKAERYNPVDKAVLFHLHLEQAHVFEDLNEVDKAIYEYNNALSVYPRAGSYNRIEAAAQRSFFMMSRGKTDAAISAFEKIRQECRESATSVNDIDLAAANAVMAELLRNAKQYDRMERPARLALKVFLDPQIAALKRDSYAGRSVQASKVLYESLKHKGRSNEATDSLLESTKAMQEQGAHYSAFLDFGGYLLANGFYEQAGECFSRAERDASEISRQVVLRDNDRNNANKALLEIKEKRELLESMLRKQKNRK
ncbi:MAG: serine/threonine protein kinase [Candidatus Obscuribacterales bacterium]|nr:serine/threonine protein kinase [Candidatus Obscuribacterales bacterium]